MFLRTHKQTETHLYTHTTLALTSKYITEGIEGISEFER